MAAAAATNALTFVRLVILVFLVKGMADVITID